MAINPNNGVLDIINGTLRVTSLDVKQGSSVSLNALARNNVLLFDDQKSTTTFMPTVAGGYMSSTGVTRNTTAGYLELGTASDEGWVYWPLQLPNAWHAEFDMHVTTAGGVLTFSLFNTSEPNHTDFTNNDGGYKIVFDNTNNQIVIYWEGSVHKTVSASLRSNDWQHVNVNYSQGATSISLAGKVVLTHEFTQNYQEFNSRYVGFSATAGTSHKIRHLRVHNGDKWLYTKTSNASDITYVSGNVGIGSLAPTELLDVHGNVHIAKDLTVDGNLRVSGTTTFIDSTNLVVEDPIIELAKGNTSDTIDAGLIVTRGASNVAIAFRGDEEELAFGYTQSGASGTDVTPIANGGLDVRVYGNLFANNLTTTANVDASYINGNVVTSNLVVSGEYTMGGRIIPDTNDAYDIGSAEKKIRDLYVSDNSLWIGDETKISFASGKMRFRKRKKNVVPAAILAAGGTATAAKTFSSKANLNDIKSHEWLKYMKTLGGKGNAIMSDVFRNNDDDYEATTAAEAWKDINDDIFSESNVSIGKTSSPTVTLDVEGDGKFSGNVVTTGNIGIRTATPSANLHVMGYQYVNGPPTLANAFDHSDAPLTLTHDTATSSTAINDPKPLLHLTRSGTNNESYGARASFNLSRYENSSTHSRSRLDVALADGTYAESTVMTLRADGKVGVGVTSPAYKLDVDGDLNLSTGSTLRINGTPAVFSNWTVSGSDIYRSSGNVGVGVTSPAYALDVDGDLNLSTGSTLRINGTPAVFSNWTVSDSDIYKPSGNVGVGVSNPAHKLDVDGDINIASGSNLKIGGTNAVFSNWTVNGSDIYRPSGNVGIGVSNPAHKLDVDGDISSSGTITGGGSGLTNLNATNLASGTVPSARIPNLDASKITSGTLGRPISTTTGVFTSTGNALLVGTDGKLGLTINDGDGNCNLTFNHASMVPDQNGSSGRIDCGVDGTTGYMRLRVKSNVTGGSSIGALPDCLRIQQDYVRAYGELYADGDVGIGTTSPAYKLDVSGTGRFTGTVTAPTFSGNATTAAALQTARTIALTGDVTGSATFDGSGNISISTTSSGGDTWTSSGTSIYYNSGKVGIGTASPARPLTIESSSFDGIRVKRTIAGGGSAMEFINGNDDEWTVGVGGTGTFGIYDGATFGEQFTIDTSGKVGIGTASPSSLLTVNAIPLHRSTYDHSEAPLTATYTATPTANATLNDPKSVLHLAREGTSSEAYGARASFKLSRYENSSTNSRTRLDLNLAHASYDDVNVMTIRSEGNVGIGVTSPGYKLDVAGDINISSGSVFRINGTALANSATITASASAGNSTLVQRHSDGYIFANYFNTTPNDVASGVTKVCVETGNDGYIRHGTSAAISTFLGLANSATIEATTADTANKIAQRNGSGDIFARLFRSDYQNQSTCTGAIAFRTSTSDNYIRFCSDMGAVRSRIGAYGNGSNITRTAHSNGYMIGSYNNVGSNDAKTNPIYTIGSNYKPSDTSLGDMYGIGYSHGNFTSILTGGWGMYVAADGDARIGLNGSSGNIKCTGHIYCGNTLYIGGSTSRGLRAVSGNYGTVQTTGGGAGGWEGYSIDGRYVFMSADNNRCGIYNDLDNEWMIYCYRNSYVKLYYNGGEKLETLGGGVKIHGSLTATGNVTAYSDIRHKKDIVKLDNALEKVEKLNGYTYAREDDGKRYTGLIAQEVLEVLPEAVVADDKDEYSLAYGNMAGLFVEAMKEMKSKLDTALARLDALENPPS